MQRRKTLCILALASYGQSQNACATVATHPCRIQLWLNDENVVRALGLGILWLKAKPLTQPLLHRDWVSFDPQSSHTNFLESLDLW